MNITLRGKRALIGGSSRGIGLAIAQQLAASGASVTLMARNESKLKKLVADLPVEADEQEHQYLVADFTNFEAYQDVITSYFKETSVDILINNTQGPKAGTSLEKKINDYQEAFDLLFKSAVFTTQLALDHMKKQQWGRIINVASVSVKEPLSYLVLSNAIRAAVVTWGKSLATEVAPNQITVNNILTGYFDTERLSELNEKKAQQLGIPVSEVKNHMISQVPMKRIGDPIEYGYLVTFLASDRASYITGANIPIDGGLLRSM
jgi:3-oxoacyl-[acyl-carrier protein] reductase